MAVPEGAAEIREFGQHRRHQRVRRWEAVAVAKYKQSGSVLISGLLGGTIQVGSSTTGLTYDDTNKCLAIGAAVDTSFKLLLQANGTNVASRLQAGGAAASAEWRVGSTTSSECAAMQGNANDASGTLMGVAKANLAAFYGQSSVVAVVVGGTKSTCDVIFAPGNSEKMRLLSGGDVVIGSGNTAATVLATNATTGFLRMPTCAGTPTGAAVDGSYVLDTTALKIWQRIGGAWKATAALT
jgi:hypothetical protein